MKKIFYRISKIISTAIFVVLVLLILLILFYIFRVNYLTKNDRLGEVKFNMYTILTQSMYPTIEAGDVIVTYRNPNDKYNDGDIITFVSESNAGLVITHRIKNVYDVNGEYSYQTQGDNNNTSDSEIVKGKNVIGQVKLRIPKVGYAQQFLTSKFGFIVAILLPCLGIVIYDILKMFKRTAANARKFVYNDEKTIAAKRKLKEVIKDEEE